MTLERATPLARDVGHRTALLHALLDGEGDPAAQLAAFMQARRELDALIKHVRNNTKKNRSTR